MVRHQGVTPPRPSSPVGALLISAGAVPPQLGRSKVAASQVILYVKLPYFSQGPITSRERRRRLLSRRGASPHSCRFQYVFLVRGEHCIAYSGGELRSRQPGKCPAFLLGLGRFYPPYLFEGCEGLPRPQRRPFSLGTGVYLWSQRGHCGRRVALGAPSQARVLLLHIRREEDL